MYSRVRNIFADLFLVDDITLDDSTAADQVEGWDSLTHINLIIAVESAFGFKFDLGELEKFKAVGDLVDAIERHLQ
ncbi:acyl carrier protein (plasmid) [Niveispirillum cyanobacteriorum]|uniref:Acyl carrier protein n=1 Tax=Niveispirillum cyanobacteriorum TaxID=1612173 RepID=A0A2K9NLM9_9PROT|nr:acyl carrier protein [Niveispirillum cyanobacteriorum]